MKAKQKKEEGNSVKERKQESKKARLGKNARK